MSKDAVPVMACGHARSWQVVYLGLVICEMCRYARESK